MNSQFTPKNNQQPEQAPISADWLLDAQPRIPAVRAELPQPAPRQPGTGLLSNWKANAAQQAQIGQTTRPRPLAEQDTLEHQVMRTPETDPLHQRNHTFTYTPGQVPPYQRGTPPPSMPAPSAPMTPPQVLPPSMGYAAPQPMASTVRANPQMQSFMPMPGTMTASAVGQAPPTWYQQYPSPPMPPETPPGKQARGKGGKKKRVPIWVRVVFVALLMLVVGIGGVGGYYYATLSAPISNILGQQAPRLKGDDDPNQTRGNGGSILSGGRINILLLGSDTDEKFTNADGSHTYLAQTDIIVTVDPASRSVSMLSIPRDFWINVPGYGLHKLDEAFGLGDVGGSSPTGIANGVALSRLTIYQDFGISINYYAWVGLDGFVKVIDTVGGVDVDVIHPIVDDQYPDDVGNNTADIYRLKRLYLTPGPQHLSGPAALEYVRSRHADLVGDFGRSARQQQVLVQLKNKLNNPNIIGDLPQLANDLNGYVRTDMGLTQVFDLLRLARGINLSKITHVTLGPPYSSPYNTPDGKAVVMPHCDLIVPVIAQMFGSTANARCNITGNSSTSALASAPTQGRDKSGPPSASDALAQASGDSVLQTAGQMLSINTMSLGGNGENDLFGIRSLLDLLFLGVFESPAGLQV